MTRPPNNQPDDSDEAQGVTQEANFPLAWIKDYNPQIHGVRPQAKIQKLQQPPAHFQQQVPPANRPPEQPRQPRPVAPPPPQQQVQPNPVETSRNQPTKKARSFPWWGWAIIAVLALLVIAETSIIVFR